MYWHKYINFNLFSVSVSAETRVEAEIQFRFGFGHKNLFRSVTNFNRLQQYEESILPCKPRFNRFHPFFTSITRIETS